MSYRTSYERPKWIKRTLFLWLFFGMPAGLAVLGLSAFGMSAADFTEPPPPPSTEFGWSVAELVAPWIVALWLYGTPLILLIGELKYRRRLERVDLTKAYDAQD